MISLIINNKHCSDSPINPYRTEIFLYKPWRPKGFFQFEIIIKSVLAGAFRFI